MKAAVLRRHGAAPEFGSHPAPHRSTGQALIRRGTLAPGAVRQWSVRIPAASLGLTAFGVYPLAAEAAAGTLGAGGRNRQDSVVVEVDKDTPDKDLDALDIAAWIDFAEHTGFSKVALVGHSAGWASVGRYQAGSGDRRVVGLVLASGMIGPAQEGGVIAQGRLPWSGCRKVKLMDISRQLGR